MGQEVRYELMQPGHVVAARDACPIAYVPIGTIEWHGLHLPLGADVVLAHALAIRCAQAGGGLVFPPLAYGESRIEGLMEAHAADHDRIAEQMKLPVSNFAPSAYRYDASEQFDNYQRLLIHILCEVQTLGFKVAVFVAGHYPLIDHARAALGLFHQIRWNGVRARMIGWAFTGHELVLDEFPTAGYHAGFWETSMMLALRPELANMTALPVDKSAKLVGVLSPEPPQDSSAEFGEQAVKLIVARAVAQARDRLAHPAAYYPHGARL